MANETQVQSHSIKVFFVLFSGQSVSLLGSQIVQFALVWWLVQETNSATVLAIAAFVGFLPHVVLGPIIGVLVDRWNRKKIMFLSDSIIALSTLFLAYIFYIGLVQIWMVYLIMFIRSIGGGFHVPAMMATTSLMIPDKYLTNVQGIRHSLYGGINIISAPLAAFLLGLMPTIGVLLIDVFTALFAIIPLLFIAVPQPIKSQDIVGLGYIQSVWSDLVTGFRYVWNWRGLRILLLCASLLNLLGAPAMILLPLLVTRHFGGNVLELGWIQSAMAIGMVIGGITLGLWGGFKKRVITSLTGRIGGGLGLIILSALPPSLYSIALIVMVLIGFMSSFAFPPLLAIIQASAAHEMQGRVFTLTMSILHCVAPLGILIAGPVADILGIRFWYVVGGIGSVIIGITLLFIPAVMHIEEGSKKAT